LIEVYSHTFIHGNIAGLAPLSPFHLSHHHLPPLLANSHIYFYTFITRHFIYTYHVGPISKNFYPNVVGCAILGFLVSLQTKIKAKYGKEKKRGEGRAKRKGEGKKSSSHLSPIMLFHSGILHSM
jgi:hypothetical protein